MILPLRPCVLAVFYILAGIATVQSCSYSHSFDDAGSLSFSEVVSFNTAPDAATSCSVSCDSGALTQIYVRYGGSADILFNDDSDFSLTGCDVSVGISSADEEFQLGYSLSVQTAFTNLKISCSCTENGGGGSGGGGGGACFSESVMVQVLNKGPVAMKDLQIGDKVLTGENRYKPVYAFGHYEQDQEQEFLRIHTKSSNEPVEITADHMIFIDQNGQQKAVRADAVEVGDTLVSAEAATVTKIDKAQKRGMYMPLTPDGTLIVNGVKASAYISIREFAPNVVENKAYYGITSEDTILHLWLTPIRMLCMGVSSSICGLPNSDTRTPKSDRSIMKWLKHGRDLVSYVEGNFASFWMQVVVIGPPIFAIFASLFLLENLFGPTLAPSAVALIVGGLIWYRQRHRCAKKKLL